MGGSAQYVDERWKWTAGTLYIVLLRSRDSDAVKSQQGLWKTVVRRNPFNGQLMQCTWITTLYGQRSEYIWTHGQWQIARLNGQGSRMRAISVFVCVVTQSWPTLCNPMDCSPPGSSVHGFPRQEYWSGFPCPPPGDLPDPGIKPAFSVAPASQVDSLLLSHQGSRSQTINCFKISWECVWRAKTICKINK